MKSVLVVNPLSSKTKNVVRDVVYGCWCKGKRIGGATVPPFVLLQVASNIKAAGMDVHFVDAQAAQVPMEEYADKIRGSGVAVISTSTMSFREDEEFLAEMKRMNPGLKTVVFGSHPTFMPEYTLASGVVDAAIRHEPYFAAVELASGLLSGSDAWKNTPGVSFKNSDGSVTSNPEKFEENLDLLAVPDVDMLPKNIDYFNPIVKRTPYITTTTSWGCPGKCSFCTAPFFDGPKIRAKSADYVWKEINYYVSKGYKEVYFRDDTFFVLKRRDTEIMRRMADARLDVAWIANARVGMIDEDMLRLAKAAGCHLIKFGIESGVQEILDKSQKGYKVEDAVAIFKAARRIGIDTHAHVMLGMPGDTGDTVRRTISYIANELKPTTATFGICTPYPGAPLFDMVAEKCPEIRDGTAVDLGNLHVEAIYNKYYTELSPEELSGFVAKAYKKFYMRPSYVLSWLGRVRSAAELKRLAMAGAKIFDFALRGD